MHTKDKMPVKGLEAMMNRKFWGKKSLKKKGKAMKKAIQDKEEADEGED